MSSAQFPPATWRLLRTPPLAGPLNMAIDEAILLAIAERQAPPTLRFFAWEPACLSLGYAQPVSDVDAARLAERGWGLVRRPTGGRAILHTDELTYSVLAPMGEPRVLGGVIESYRQLSLGLLRGLEILGLNANAEKKEKSPTQPSTQSQNPVCFEVPSDYEITANGQKLLGSAQVRKKGVVLQHGTLPLVGEIARICEALVFADEAERANAKERVRTRATTLEAVLGTAPTWNEAAHALQNGFSHALNLNFELGELSALEREHTQRLLAEKYAAQVWTARV
ncbi:MAG: lipoate--protein ligase family protein [Anaerolineales bacterium]|nr:lipoate--protein ligase family protein [Anaerolineales bacterium]